MIYKRLSQHKTLVSNDPNTNGKRQTKTKTKEQKKTTCRRNYLNPQERIFMGISKCPELLHLYPVNCLGDLICYE